MKNEKDNHAENKTEKDNVQRERYRALIKSEAKRKMEAKKHQGSETWMGLSTMGMVGWSIVVPTLLGVALGRFMDDHITDGYSWTLMMMSLGLFLGCVTAGYWVKREGTTKKK